MGRSILSLHYILLITMMLYCITNLSNLSKVLKIVLVDNIDNMCIRFYVVRSSLHYTTSRLGTSAPYIRSMSEIARCVDSNKYGSLMITKTYKDENLAMIKLSQYQIEYNLVIKVNNLS